jgi:hypothetical protein
MVPLGKSAREFTQNYFTKKAKPDSSSQLMLARNCQRIVNFQWKRTPD